MQLILAINQAMFANLPIIVKSLHSVWITNSYMKKLKTITNVAFLEFSPTCQDPLATILGQ